MIDLQLIRGDLPNVQKTYREVLFDEDAARIAAFVARASMISLRLVSFARRLSGFLMHEGRVRAPATRIPRTTRLRFIIDLRIQDARRPAPRGTPLFKSRSIYVPDGRDQAGRKPSNAAGDGSPAVS